MINTNEDIYDFIRFLIIHLQKDGQVDWSLSLKDAMNIGTMSGEVLGEIRIKLKALSQTDLLQKYKVEQEAKQCINYLDKVLGPY